MYFTKCENDEHFFLVTVIKENYLQREAFQYQHRKPLSQVTVLLNDERLFFYVSSKLCFCKELIGAPFVNFSRQ